MKNNRCGPHTGRGDPRLRSGSRGDPPVTCGVRGDPPWMLASRGDPPLLKRKGEHPLDVENMQKYLFVNELIFRIIDGKNLPQGRGLSNDEQHPSLPRRRLPCTHKYKWLEPTTLNGSAVVIQMDGINSIPTIQVEPKALTYKSRRDDSCCSLGFQSGDIDG
jgi:hypothetical protein